MPRVVILLCLALSACSEHTMPPQPTGSQIPVNADLWDYHGNEIFPVQN